MCLFSRAYYHSQLKHSHEAVQKEFFVVLGKTAELEAAGRASQTELVATHEKAILREAACTRAEVELFDDP